MRGSLRGLTRITLHECRHPFAPLMIAAGANARVLLASIGDATIAITLDRYGHPFFGPEAQVAALLDRCLVAQKKTAEEAGSALAGK